MQELDQIRAKSGGCPTGSAVVTAAGLLPARFVFHAVGPVYHDGKHREPELLASCYRTCLKHAEEQGIKTIAFPSISTGAYGYPIREAAQIAITQVAQHFNTEGSTVRQVTIVLFSEEDYRVYANCLEPASG